MSVRQKIKPVYITIAYLAFKGFKAVDIAKRVGLHPVTVNQILNAPIVHDLIKSIESRMVDTLSDIQTDLQAAAPGALHTVIELSMTSKNDAVRSRNALAILEMAGHSPIKRSKIEHTTTESEVDSLTEEQIRAEVLKGLDPEKVEVVEEPITDVTVH